MGGFIETYTVFYLRIYGMSCASFDFQLFRLIKSLVGFFFAGAACVLSCVYLRK